MGIDGADLKKMLPKEKNERIPFTPTILLLKTSSSIILHYSRTTTISIHLIQT